MARPGAPPGRQHADTRRFKNATEEIERLSRRLDEAGASSFMRCFSITTVPAPFPVAANNIAMLLWTEG